MTVEGVRGNRDAISWEDGMKLINMRMGPRR
jgi:hypothetical protein